MESDHKPEKTKERSEGPTAWEPGMGVLSDREGEPQEPGKSAATVLGDGQRSSLEAE